MNGPSKENQSTKYCIRVKNHLDAHWEHWFEGMAIQHAEGGETILTGDVKDQAALHGLLEKIYALNLSLISVQKINSE